MNLLYSIGTIVFNLIYARRSRLAVGGLPLAAVSR